MDDLEPSTVFWLWVQHTCRVLCRLGGPSRCDGGRLNLAVSRSHSWFCFPLLSGPGLHLKSYKHTLEGVPACAQLPGSGPPSTSVGRAGPLAGAVSPWILAPELESAVCPPS